MQEVLSPHGLNEVAPGQKLEIAPQISYFKNCLEELREYRQRRDSLHGAFVPLDKRQWELKHVLRKQGKPLPKDVPVTVYNTSVTFNHHNREFTLGRTEELLKINEDASSAVPFLHRGEQWIPQFSPVLPWQDPHITYVNGLMFAFGVEIKKDKDSQDILYRMAFHKGKDIEDLKFSFNGPWGQKGIVPCVVPMREKNQSRQIGLYTRPQGKIGGAGQIGFTIVDSIEELEQHSLEIIENAPLLNTRFPNGEWGGVNQVILLKDGRNLLIGHRAYIDQSLKKHYYPWACIHDPFTGEVEDLGILAERADFDPSHAKAPDLEDVLYTIGVIKKDGSWYLLVGISDAYTGTIKLAESRLFPEKLIA